MLNKLYENIGGKIKNWAKWLFIVEAISAIITGIVLIVNDDDYITHGILTLICGPIVAWVGSWLMYAFGQLVEDVHAMRNKEGTTDEEKAKCKETFYSKHEAEVKTNAPQNINNKPQYNKSNICQCGERFFGDICPNCGRKVIVIQDTDVSDNSHRAIQCECGELHYSRYCPVCGKKAETPGSSRSKKSTNKKTVTPAKSNICKCGERFYGDTCPNCGRNIKDI